METVIMYLATVISKERSVVDKQEGNCIQDLEHLQEHHEMFVFEPTRVPEIPFFL